MSISFDNVFQEADQIRQSFFEIALQEAHEYKHTQNAYLEAQEIADKACKQFKETIAKKFAEPCYQAPVQIILNIKPRKFQIDLKEQLYNILKPKELPPPKKRSIFSWKKV